MRHFEAGLQPIIPFSYRLLEPIRRLGFFDEKRGVAVDVAVNDMTYKH